MPGQEITVTATDGGRFTAYLTPPPSTPAPGLLVLPEIYNINDHIRGVAEGFAAEGYLVLAPDVFWRVEPETYLPYTPDGQTRARALNQRLDVDALIEDLGACVATLKAHPDCTGKVGAILAWLTSCQPGAAIRRISPRAVLAARGESLAAFDRRGIPPWAALDVVHDGSNTPGLLPPPAWPRPTAASIQRGLGATRDVHHGLRALA